jgi:glutamate formiminotransferase/formiminotetrahydrofolate cyclodeaminase
MPTRLIECVPNFSEGRDLAVIKEITNAIESVEGITLLDVDPGKATNRTVVTFVGEPEPVIEAAVRAGRRAKELIDMRGHKGEHPRFGAMDVCPLVPIAGVTMAEAAAYARELGQRLGAEAGISGYFYEAAATRPERKNLATVRAGEYEGLPQKLADPSWRTDFGPGTFDPGYGVTAVGARKFLIAYNVNLNTTSTRRANAIAFDIREKGRVKREPDPATGKVVRDEKGEEVWIPGSLKAVKAIGWFIEEYGIAQISINLTDIDVTPVHVAFDECAQKAATRGVRVTGSEIVGMVPLRVLVEAGEHYLRQQGRSLGVPHAELVKIAVKSLGLAELSPFDPEKRVIEYAIRDKSRKRLVDLSLVGFTHVTASESPAPGGGSVAAAVGALGAALGTMVANLSSHKPGWDARWEEFSASAVKGRDLHERLLALVDADTAAFNAIMEAWKAPTEVRQARIEAATVGAIEVPLAVMRDALAALDVCRLMAETGMDASLSDAAVGALCARTAVRGAGFNVRINAKGLTDPLRRAEFIAEADHLEAEAAAREESVVALVRSKL